MAASSAVTGIIFLRQFGRARRDGLIDAAAWYVFAFGMLVTLPLILVAATGSLSIAADGSSQMPGWEPKLLRYGLFAACGMSALMIISAVGQRRRRCHLRPAPLILAVLWAVATIVGRAGEGWHVTLASLALLSGLLVAAVTPPSSGAAFGAAAVGITHAVLGGLLLVGHYGSVMLACTNKCGIFGTLYSGTLLEENTFGILLAATIPFAYLVLRGRARVWMVAYLLVMVAATGSRTSLVAALLGTAVLVMVRPSLRGDDAARSPLAWGAATLSGAAAFVLPFLPLNPDDFTGRAYLWTLAIKHIHEHPWFGLGPAAWANFEGQSLIVRRAVYSTHNEWIEALFVAGIVGAALLATFLVTLAVSAGKVRTATLAIITFMLLLGGTERSWSFVDADWMSFTLLATCLLGAMHQRPAAEGSELGQIDEALLGDQQRARARHDVAARA